MLERVGFCRRRRGDPLRSGRASLGTQQANADVRKRGLLVAALAAIAALGLASAALAARPAAGVRFHGRTSQGRAISFRVANTGKRILDLHFYLVTHCHRGSSFITSQGNAPSRTTSSVKPNGRFVWHTQLPWHRYPAGFSSKASVTFSGRFQTAERAGGILKGVAYYSNGDVCSGRTSFTVTG